jgi:hypothetical protein
MDEWIYFSFGLVMIRFSRKYRCWIINRETRMGSIEFTSFVLIFLALA